MDIHYAIPWRFILGAGRHVGFSLALRAAIGNEVS
jgi:hypothetical protein